MVGSGQYLHGLVKWFPRVGPQHHYWVLRPSPTGPAPPPGVTCITLNTAFDRLNHNLAKLVFEQLVFPRAAARLTRNQGASVLFVPYFGPPFFSRLPVVTTVGDIIPLILPEYRGAAHVRSYLALVSRAVHRSAHVLTFSNASRRDIHTMLQLPPERVSPILLAAGDQYSTGDPEAARAEVARRYGISEPFIYYVGGFDVRKNVTTLIRAFALIRNREAHTTLVLAGKALGGDQRMFPDLDGLIADLDLEAKVRRIHVPPQDGPLLYQACSVFAFPSRYEGFGLPPLEAMACGAPVIVSDTSSLPEVVGTAALRVAPNDVTGWAAALTRLLHDPELRRALRTQGLEQAAHFSYERVATETLDILARVAHA
jgi:glycosyltransferase involved in cell wall biosynthesis